MERDFAYKLGISLDMIFLTSFFICVIPCNNDQLVKNFPGDLLRFWWNFDLAFVSIRYEDHLNLSSSPLIVSKKMTTTKAIENDKMSTFEPFQWSSTHAPWMYWTYWKFEFCKCSRGSLPYTCSPIIILFPFLAIWL